MQRFFVNTPLSIDMDLTDLDVIHQVTRVLRAKIGESIILFDGDGSETVYEIVGISKKSLSLRGKNRRFPQSEPEKYITLYQSLPNKIEKIEYILQKWVEVGISRFIFFRSDFSQKLIISENKKIRFMAIVREAVEQCGGMTLPEIHFLDTIDFFRKREEKNLTLDTLGEQVSVSHLPIADKYNIWIGPEGGWSNEEREKMNENGFLFVRFWERVLRTETAGVVSSFALLHA